MTIGTKKILFVTVRFNDSLEFIYIKKSSNEKFSKLYYFGITNFDSIKTYV